MKLETLKKVCDNVIGIDSEFIRDGKAEEEVMFFQYRSKSGAVLLNVPVGEHNPNGWHLQGKVECDEEDLYDSLHRAYRLERMKEVSAIQRNRGFVKSEGEKRHLTDRIKKLEGALRIARDWMGKSSEEGDFQEENALRRDAAFVEQTLENNPEYLLENEE